MIVKEKLQQCAPPDTPSSTRHFRQAVGITTLLGLLTIYWFGSFPFHALMGDDLVNIAAVLKSGSSNVLTQALTNAGGNKYRPVFSLIFHLETSVFGETFRWYVYFNMFMELANACLVSLIAWRLSKSQWLISLAAGIMFVVSRFSYYYVLQATGFLEALALFFFLLLLLGTVQAYESKRARDFFWPSLCYFLALYTHERYMVVGAFLVLAILLAPRKPFLSAQKLLLATIPVVIFATNYLLKTVVFNSRFFEGTGGTEITFGLYQFAFFMTSGLANLVGFNAGPDYLSGLSLPHAGSRGIALGLGLSTSFAIPLGLYIREKLKESTRSKLLEEILKVLLFSSLLIPLLASASITIRQEYRWLYTPYVIVILATAYISARSSASARIGTILVLLVLIASVSVDTFYRQYVNNIFFFDGLRVADSAKDRIIDQYRNELSSHEIFLINTDKDVRNWYFSNNAFFQLYSHDSEMIINYVDSIEGIPRAENELNRSLVFAFDSESREVIDVTVKAREELSKTSLPKKESKFDFLQAYESGKINSTREVSTPNKQGSFVTSWSSELGPVNTITVISGFSYSFDEVPLQKGDTLSFSAVIPFEDGDGALAYIEVADNANRKRIFIADLLPTKRPLKWKDYVIALDGHDAQRVNITFGVESPSADLTADWVAFARPRILSAE